jgi:hypothetical protein
MLDHRAIIDLWKPLSDRGSGAEALARRIDEKYDTVLRWRLRNSIPRWKWPAVVEAARADGLSITADTLMTATPDRRRNGETAA